LEEGSYQTLPDNLSNSEILGEGSFQTSPENLNNLRIPEEMFPYLHDKFYSY